jgi:HD-GYP domain-containing protein (c-di-GMP phosphodiesterase class II)
MFGKRKIHAPLFDLVIALSEVTDMVDPVLNDHQKKVGFIASSLAREMGAGPDDCRDLLIAGMLHDIGALSLRERTGTLRFELSAPHRHAEMGALLVREFGPLAGVADLIRFHHVPWAGGDGRRHRGQSVPDGAHILHLADRAAVLATKRTGPGALARTMSRKVADASGRLFMPDATRALASLARKDYFCLDLLSGSLDRTLEQMGRVNAVELDGPGILGLARVFSGVIDFRSRFTAAHSRSVAIVAEALARFVGFSEHEGTLIRVAGYLHDLGKLAVPAEILEKASPLTAREAGIMRSHPFHTYRALQRIEGLGSVARWSAFHHECLDGCGYPFQLSGTDLPLGSRIVAVADVFSALAEDRPYRRGMDGGEILVVIRNMVQRGQLDRKLADLLISNREEISGLLHGAQAEGRLAYRNLQDRLGEAPVHPDGAPHRDGTC